MKRYIIFFILIVMFMAPFFVFAKTFKVVPPGADEITEAILEASAQTKVRPAILYGVLAQETAYGRNLGKTEGEWSAFCQNRSTDDCGRWKTYDCKPDYGNARSYDEILRSLGYMDAKGRAQRQNIPTSSTCAIGFTQFEPRTWETITRNRAEKIFDPWDINDSMLVAALFLQDLGADENEVISAQEIFGLKDRTALARYYCGGAFGKPVCQQYARSVEQKARLAYDAVLKAEFRDRLERLEREYKSLKGGLAAERAPLKTCAEVLTDEFGFGTKLDEDDAFKVIADLDGKTQELSTRLRLFEKLKDSETLAEIEKILEKRKALMVESMYRDPARTVFYLMLEGDRKTIGDLYPQCVEREAELEGSLDVFHVDFDDGTFQTQYFLNLDDGSTVILHSSGGLYISLESGMRVRVKGLRLDGEVIFNGMRSLSEPHDASGGIDVISEPGNPPVSGEQKIIVIMAYFANTVEPSLTREAVSNVVFGEVNRFYQENSYGAVSLSGDIKGWYKLPLNQSCNAQSAWSSAIRAADNEVNYRAYQRVILIAPLGPKCDWGGYATNGKTSVGTAEGNVAVSISAIRTGFVNLEAVAHELGHNFGNHHAAFLLCKKVAIADSGCDYQEYGDAFDIMGKNNSGHMNALHKEVVGWLSGEQIITVREPGIYSIAPIEKAGGGPKALKIQRKYNDYLFVEYRQALGYDRGFRGDHNAYQGAMLHVRDTFTGRSAPNRSVLIDPTPPGSAKNSALLSGLVFSDPANGAVITVLGVSPDELRVRVDPGKKDFTPPKISIISPEQQQTVSGKIRVSAAVTHKSAMDWVEFYYVRRGEQVLFGKDSSAPYDVELDTQNFPHGLNYILVKARDISGNEGISLNVGFFVEAVDTGPPHIRLLSPRDGDELPNPISFSAEADDDLGIHSVVFHLDSGSPEERIITDKTRPYRTEPRYLAAGSHRIWAEARDLSGKTSRSEEIYFGVAGINVSQDRRFTPNVVVPLEEKFTVAESEKPAPPLPQNSEVLARGTVGTAYSAKISATNTPSDILWQVSPGYGDFPPGLELEQATGIIRGTPREVGIYDFTAKAVDRNDRIVMLKPLRIEVINPIMITTTKLPKGVVGVRFAVEFRAEGAASPFRWSIPPGYGEFPSGLSLAENGAVSGIPSEEGKWSFTIVATDRNGAHSQKTYVIEIGSPLKITTSELPKGIGGVYYRAELRASGEAKPPYRWSVSDGRFPPGLSLDPVSGFISGTPSEEGEWVFMVKVEAEDGANVRRELRISIKPVFKITSRLPTGVARVLYIATSTALGGTPPYTWSYEGGGLPQGFTLQKDTGVIYGISQDAGTWNISLKVTDTEGISVSQWEVIDIREPLKIIAPLGALKGNVGVHFGTTTSARGGSYPYSWSISSGSLPPGLALDPNGYLSGRPESEGSWNATLMVKDQTNNIATQEIRMIVISSPVIATSTLPIGFVGVPYSVTPSVSGGIPPYSWSINYGDLPVGLSLDTDSGKISGTPTEKVSKWIYLEVTDADRVKGPSEGFGIDIKEKVSITTDGFLNGSAGIYYGTSTLSSGGVYPYLWSIISGELPPGLSMASSSGYISGTPTQEGIFNFILQVRDAVDMLSTKDLRMEITPRLSILASYAFSSATAGISYSTTTFSSGGTPPYTWSISSGNLPSGLLLDSSTGVISGTPGTPGNYNFVLKVMDSHGVSISQSQTLEVKSFTSILRVASPTAVVLNALQYFFNSWPSR